MKKILLIFFLQARKNSFSCKKKKKTQKRFLLYTVSGRNTNFFIKIIIAFGRNKFPTIYNDDMVVKTIPAVGYVILKK